MERLKTINYLDLYAIPDLCNKNFFIPDYQRGYRWGEVQVRQLLEDVYGFIYDKNSSGNFYCLQPIVVKKMSEEDVVSIGLTSNDDNNIWYEVIDGQQRLTTIKIILALEKALDRFNKMHFNMYYKTRHELGSQIDNLIINVDDENDKYSVNFRSGMNNDIDSWHILKAANIILNWFQDGGKYFKPTIQEFKGRFYEIFTNTKDKDKSVQVIWYELRDKSDPYDMFKRLNDKSISLNNAELIRGMFLSDSAKYKYDEQILNQFNAESREAVKKRELARKQSHIIEQWDIIESQLRDERFWAFVKKEKDTKGYSCRIEYIFDLISKKTPDQRDVLYTYLTFDDMIKSKMVEDLWKLWLIVETYFSLLYSWYKDSYYYHKIGFLVTELGSGVLIDLLSEAVTSNKSTLNDSITKKIYECIHDRKKPKRRILDYTYKDDYNMLKRVLFLYNVESTYQQKLDFFPFDKYKELNWTLEHIHAQNSEHIDQSDKEKWVEWFEENNKALARLKERLSNDDNFISLYTNFTNEHNRLLKNKNNYSFKEFCAVFDDVLKFFDSLNEKDNTPSEVHGISNMALLDPATNSSVGNSVFEVKRQRIMDADAKGEYIPICTRKVFMKYYNNNDSDFTVQQIFYWSEKDRKHYLENIMNVLKQYIELETKTEGGTSNE